MPYDEALAERIRKRLGIRAGLIEKKMFGGIAFLLNGNMCVGVHKDALIARIDPEDTTSALETAHTRLFDITGRPMKGWILVEPPGMKGPRLTRWIDRSAKFVRTLPRK